MADLLDQRLNELNRRHRLQMSFDQWAPLLTISLLLAALIIMAIRLSGIELSWAEWPICIAAALLPCLVIPKKWREQIPQRTLAAELDLMADGRGLCMALAQNETAQRDQDWLARLRVRLEDFQLPPFRWHAARFIPIVLVTLLIACCLPRFIEDDPTQHRYDGFFDDLSMSIEQMADQDLISPELAAEKKQEIEQLKAKAQEKGMNQEIWLARDRLKSYIDHQKQSAAQRIAEALHAAEQLQQQQNKKQQNQLTQALAQLAQQNQTLLKKALNAQALQQMAAMMQQAKQEQHLTPQQLAALQQQLQQQGLSQEQLARMQQAGMPQLSPEQMRQFAQSLKNRLDQQCKGLGQCGINMNALLSGLRPGKGGITRGPGHVQLTEKEATQTETGNAQALAPGMRVNPDGSITLAETVREADLSDEAKQAAQRAALQQFDPSAADARRSVSAPRHRAAIAQYFIEQKRETPAPEQPPAPKDSPTPEETDIP